MSQIGTENLTQILSTTTGPANISEVGGTAVPTVNSVPSLPTITPIERVAFLSNVAVKANTNILTAALAPTLEGTYRVRVLLSVSTTFAIVEINSASATTGASQSVVGTIEQGIDLVAGSWYEVTFPAGPHETYNFQAGAAANCSLRVQFLSE